MATSLRTTGSSLEKINPQRENKSKDMELTVVNQQLVRREETVTPMEREIPQCRDREDEDINEDEAELDATMAEPATSYCIKCKKSLDDLSKTVLQF